ncbi:YihY/virulence factor BrkB family protein [Altererythrobacter sp. GH1-8]|uniref:YihY/virulence factor BrkB family protein n=1 Tax=Altererythrobacter sp. GH1-8 TaxID=3349333 RepID=UPI00374DBE5D
MSSTPPSDPSPAERDAIGDNTHVPDDTRNLIEHVICWFGPDSRTFRVLKRSALGTYNDGFIHAGNLAYLSMLAIFPFFILGAALFTLFGEQGERAQMIAAVLAAMPPTVYKTIAPVAQDVIEARSGWLLWIGAGVALWTVSSLVETIRDIMRRAYGAEARHAFWKYRLFSFALVLVSVVLLLVSLVAQVLIGTAQQLIAELIPNLQEWTSTLRITRGAPAIVLFGSLWVIFYSVTPERFRGKGHRVWPGALFTTLWWMVVATLMPLVLGSVFTYDLTYGSLAGIMVALFFFWLVGLGVVIGAELNAALALTKTGVGEGSSQASAEDEDTQ